MSDSIPIVLAADINQQGTILPLVDNVLESGGSPFDVTFYSFNLAQLTPGLVAGIENGTETVFLEANVVTSGGTADLGFDGVGITPATESSLAAGTADPAVFTALTNSADLLGTAQAGPIQNQTVENVSSAIATALKNGSSNFLVGAYATSGNNVEVTTSLVVTCYAAGTRILTARGEIEVEALRVGDLAMALRAGGFVPIRWLGHRRVDLRAHPAPEKVWPIRVQAGAFAEGRPHRDLWLSPGHSVFVDGVLIQIEKLVNGATIAQVPRDQVTYWHVELESHDLLLAEGLPAESYLDSGNRSTFENGSTCLQLHPDFLPRHWAETCVPLILSGPQVAAVKERLLRRALTVFGYALTEEQGLHLLADGWVIVADPTRAGLQRFVVPRGARDVWLVSRNWVPAEVEPESSDVRRLGVCVRRLLLDDRCDMPLDHPALAEGWHQVEPHEDGGHRRWTGGAARLPAGAESISIELTGKRAYWAQPDPRIQAGELTGRAA